MMEINEPQITIESLMDKIRDGARRQVSPNGAADSGASSATNLTAAGRAANPSAPAADSPPALTQLEAVQLTLQPGFEARSDDQYHAGELLQYHDRQFIQNAYRAILKRGPDATGYTAFIESLRSGRLNKVDVLARLRYSTEGRAKKVQVKGLFLPAAVRQLYRLPLVGYLLRLGVGLARLPGMVRNQQQFEAHVHAQQQLVADHANHLSTILSQHQKEVSRALAQLSESTRTAATQQQLGLLKQEQQETSLRGQRELALLKQEQQAMRAALLKRFDVMQAGLIERLDAVKQQFDVLIDKAVSHWQREMQSLDARHGEQSGQAIERAEQLTASVRIEVEQLARQLRAEVGRVFQKEQEVSAELSLQRQRTARLLEETTGRLPAPSGNRQLEAMADEQQHLHDAFYLSLEESFRGSAAEIKERLKVYLPLVEQARAPIDAQPLLDIGCGRGEWLELLRETGVPANGVDSNRALVAEGRARGLSIIEADVLAHLRQLPDESLGALTGFHIVEHLPLEMLLGLLDEAVRVVRPGGLVIFETPNPENVLVGSCNFYFDPTHRNPLPAPMMKFLLESRGFNRVEILRLNPSDAEPVAGDTDLVKRFNQYFYGPMDYAVVGWKG
jgi:O-antigen chain-terminating methyltransferase